MSSSDDRDSSNSTSSSTDSDERAKSWSSWKAQRKNAAKVLVTSRKRDLSPAAVGISMPVLSSEASEKPAASEVGSGSFRLMYVKCFLKGSSATSKKKLKQDRKSRPINSKKRALSSSSEEDEPTKPKSAVKLNYEVGFRWFSFQG